MRQGMWGYRGVLRCGKKARHKVAALCVAASFLGVAALPAHAQGAEPELSPFDLSPEQLFGATVISASKTIERLWDVPAAAYVLTGEDIRKSGATSIPEALRMVPGVQVARVTNSSWAVSVRGFNAALANKLLVLVDGREVYNPLFSGVYWDVQDMVLDDIERIEVIRGPGASLWGANAVNGVINIITKHTRDTQGNLASAVVGNEERAIGSLRHGGKFGKKGFYRASAKFLRRDEQRSLLPGGTESDDWAAWHGGFRADWGGENGEDAVTLLSHAYSSNADQFHLRSLLVPPFTVLSEETVRAQGLSALARWQHNTLDGGRLTLQSYVDYTRREQILLEDERIAFDADSQYEFPALGRHLLLVGGRYRLIADDLGTQGDVADFTPPNRIDSIFSAFIQDKITLVPERWFLTLGSKLEHNEYTGFQVEPSARLQWHVDNKRMVWGSVASAARSPSRIDRDLSILGVTSPPGAILPLPTSLVLTANRNFGDESLISYELGYRQHVSKKVEFDAAAFYNVYDNLQVADALPPVLVNDGINPPHFRLPVIATNNMSGETYGMETVVTWEASDTLQFSASYSLLEMMLHAPGVLGLNLETAEQQSPQHQANIRAHWDFRDNMALDTTLYYVSALDAFQVDEYVRLDIGWSWKLDDTMHFQLVGQNLLDSAHREFSSPGTVNATEIERSIYGKLTWRF